MNGELLRNRNRTSKRDKKTIGNNKGFQWSNALYTFTKVL